MKRLILSILLLGCVYAKGAPSIQTTPTNSYLYSWTNILAHFGYNGTNAFTNGIISSNRSVRIMLNSTNLVPAAYTFEIWIWDTNKVAYTTNPIVSATAFFIPNLISSTGIVSTLTGTTNSYDTPNANTAFYSHGVPGITTNMMAPDSTKTKTNLWQFSGGILTNIVNNY